MIVTLDVSRSPDGFYIHSPGRSRRRLPGVKITNQRDPRRGSILNAYGVRNSSNKYPLEMRYLRNLSYESPKTICTCLNLLGTKLEFIISIHDIALPRQNGEGAGR